MPQRWTVVAVVEVSSGRDIAVVADRIAAGLTDVTIRVEGRRLWLSFSLADQRDVAWFLPPEFGDRQFIVRRG